MEGVPGSGTIELRRVESVILFKRLLPLLSNAEISRGPDQHLLEEVCVSHEPNAQAVWYLYKYSKICSHLLIFRTIQARNSSSSYYCLGLKTPKGQGYVAMQMSPSLIHVPGDVFQRLSQILLHISLPRHWKVLVVMEIYLLVSINFLWQNQSRPDLHQVSISGSL